MYIRLYSSDNPYWYLMGIQELTPIGGETVEIEVTVKKEQ